jgi:type II secretory pathway component GspD/PulD (secretin)
VADDTTNSLLVTSSQADFEKLEKLVAKLDVEPDAGEGRPYRLFALPQSIDAEQFARQVERTWNRAEQYKAREQRRQARQLSIGAEPASNSLIVAGNPSQFRDFEAMVKELMEMRPPGQRQVRVINVRNVDPREVKRLVDEITETRRR